MPMVTPQFLRWFLKKSRRQRATFTSSQMTAGFPFFLSRECQMTVGRELRSGRLALANLAETLEAQIVLPPVRYRRQLVNLNTPEDLARLVRKTARRLTDA
jgi:molybdopterin-guanine dinucleotide biosynthesis protein A